MIFSDAAYQSLLPSIVSHDDLVEGNSKFELSRSFAGIVGPGVGGWLVQVLRVFLGLLRQSDFLKLWLGLTGSLFGMQVSGLALPLTAVLLLGASARDPRRFDHLSAAVEGAGCWERGTASGRLRLGAPLT